MPPRIVKPALLYILVIGLAIMYAFACGGVDCKDPKNASSAACVTQTAVVECAGGDLTGAIAQYTPAVETIVSHGLNPDGSINYSAIETDLITAVAKYGWCVVSNVFDHYIHPAVPPAGSGSGSAMLAKAGPPAPTPAAAKDAFERLRAKVSPTLKFHTPSGNL